MRPIHLARLDKVRPALLLTRETVRADRTQLTVAPITSTIRGIATEVSVGRANGLDRESVVLCDNVQTIDVHDVGPLIGFLHQDQEFTLTVALIKAFDLRVEELP